MASFSSVRTTPRLQAVIYVIQKHHLCRFNALIWISLNGITETTVIWMVVRASSPRWQPNSIFLIEQKKVCGWFGRRLVITMRKRGDIDGHITTAWLMRLGFRLLSVFIEDFYQFTIVYLTAFLWFGLTRLVPGFVFYTNQIFCNTDGGRILFLLLLRRGFRRRFRRLHGRYLVLIKRFQGKARRQWSSAATGASY